MTSVAHADRSPCAACSLHLAGHPKNRPPCPCEAARAYADGLYDHYLAGHGAARRYLSAYASKNELPDSRQKRRDSRRRKFAPQLHTVSPPTIHPMTPEEIRAALRAAGVRISDLADEAKRHRVQAYHVVAGRCRSEAIEAAIAAAIGRTPLEVFGPKKPKSLPGRKKHDKIAVDAARRIAEDLCGRAGVRLEKIRSAAYIGRGKDPAQMKLRDVRDAIILRLRPEMTIESLAYLLNLSRMRVYQIYAERKEKRR